MKMLVQLLLVCYLPFSLCAFCTVPGYDTKYPGDEWRVFDCGLTIVDNPEEGQLSLLECGQRCKQVDGCKAFYYTFDKQTCQLQTGPYTERISSNLTVCYKPSQKGSKVAFHAEDIDKTSIMAGSPVIFSKAVLNDGGLYNQETGKFTAATKGVYSFSVTICSHQNKWFQVQIVTSSNSIVASAAQYTWAECTSSTGLVQLNPDDSVWVKTTYYEQGAFFQDVRRHQTFSGVLQYTN